MNDESNPVPKFFPVPRRCERELGWTPERQRGFIEELCRTGSVKAAAQSVNMTPAGAYKLRRYDRRHPRQPPAAGRLGSHEPASAQERAAVEWRRHLWARRIGCHSEDD